MRYFLAFLIAATVMAGCSSNDDAAKQREAETKALQAKQKKLAEATKPEPGANVVKKAPPVEQLIADCKAGKGSACQGACALKDGDSCSALGRMFETGTGGVPEDFESAMVFHRQACELGSGQGCYAVGLFYKLGKEIPKNPKGALHYFQEGCKLKFQPACAELEAEKKK